MMYRTACVHTVQDCLYKIYVSARVCVCVCVCVTDGCTVYCDSHEMYMHCTTF